MRMSHSRVTEVFYDQIGDPVEVYPRFCFDDRTITTGNSKVIQSGITLPDQLKQKPNSTVAFFRTFALGDILLLTPVFNWLKEHYPESRILFVTVGGFKTVFQYWSEVESCDRRLIPIRDYDVGYFLNGIVERDHSGGPESYKHRLDLYCEFLGVPKIKDPLFTLPYSDKERSWAELTLRDLKKAGKPIVVMQAFGSTTIKKFSLKKTLQIAYGLLEVCSIVLVHNHKEETNDIEGMMNLTGKTNVHELTALIDCADAVVSMDSGVLWISHCTQTPVIALLGPTREEERLSYHRNYHLVNLSKMVGCEPCFERQTKCHGAIHCMIQSDTDKIIQEIKQGIKKLIA